jgi:hypothetical protein
MMTYTFQVWTYKFNVSELKEMIKNASGEDLKTLEAILSEVGDFGDDEQIWIEAGDKSNSFSTSLSELETDTEDIIGFLQNQDFENGNMWS